MEKASDSHPKYKYGLIGKIFGIVEHPPARKVGITETYQYKYTTSRFAYYLIGMFAIVLARVFWRFKVEGKENLPKDVHCVFMPNHVSHLDSFAVAIPLYPKRPIHFIADEKLFKNPIFRRLAPHVNVFPVRKGAKQVGIVKYSEKIVRRGGTLLWYPEGQRHKQPWLNKCNPGKIGSGWLAIETKVPIIPVFLRGPEKAMPVGKSINWGRRFRSIEIFVKYGKPVYLDDLRQLPPSKEVAQEAVNRIINSIEALRNEVDSRNRDESRN